MDITALSQYRCPRWNELPSLSLYMDQVLIVVDDALSALSVDDASVATSSMINNYVKMKMIDPPENKKYSREHVAQLIMLSLLKRVLSMSEITVVLDELHRDNTAQQAYDMFCDELERCLHETLLNAGREESGAPEIFAAAVKALTGKLVFEFLLADWESRKKLAAESDAAAE